MDAHVKTNIKAISSDTQEKKTHDRGGWKRLADEALKKLRAAPHP